MTDDPLWPIPAPHPIPRFCHAPGGGGGGSRAAAWDEAALLRALRGSRPAAARVVRAFLEDGPRVAQGLREAANALDLDSLHRQAHRLKGNASILRAKALADAAERIERIAAGSDLSPVGDHLAALERHLAELHEEMAAFLERVEPAPAG